MKNKRIKYMKDRYESIMLGGALTGVLLGVIAFFIIHILCINYGVAKAFPLSVFGAVFIAVVAVIGNRHYVTEKLMMIEAIETLHEIKDSLVKPKKK